MLSYLPTFFVFVFHPKPLPAATRLIDVPISVDSDFGCDRKKKHKILIINFYIYVPIVIALSDVSLTDIPFYYYCILYIL